MKLTFELNPGGESLEVHGDHAGLQQLANMLRDLLEGDVEEVTHDDVHLMAPLWGGHELSGDAVGENNVAMKSVKIFRWSDDFFMAARHDT